MRQMYEPEGWLHWTSIQIVVKVRLNFKHVSEMIAAI